MTSKPLTAGNPNPKHARTRKRILKKWDAQHQIQFWCKNNVIINYEIWIMKLWKYDTKSIIILLQLITYIMLILINSTNLTTHKTGVKNHTNTSHTMQYIQCTWWQSRSVNVSSAYDKQEGKNVHLMLFFTVSTVYTKIPQLLQLLNNKCVW